MDTKEVSLGSNLILVIFLQNSYGFVHKAWLIPNAYRSIDIFISKRKQKT
jgi:hypothetical protein